MKRTTVILFSVVALAAIIAVPLLYAQSHGRQGNAFGGGNGFGGIMMLGRLEHAKQELGLSDQQVSDIQAILQQLRDQNAPYRTSIRTSMQSIAQTLLANPNDVATAQNLLNQQNAAEEAIKTNTLAAVAKALNLLTADQRAKLATKLAQHGAHN